MTPEKGQISIDGKILSGKLLQNWKKVVGYVSQESFLFHESIKENLLKANPTASEPQLWEALENASARTFVSKLPHGLETIVRDRGVKLSGGERHIQKALEKLQRKLTIGVIAHRFSTIENADYVVVLDRGKISKRRAHEKGKIVKTEHHQTN